MLLDLGADYSLLHEDLDLRLLGRIHRLDSLLYFLKNFTSYCSFACLRYVVNSIHLSSVPQIPRLQSPCSPFYAQ